MSTQTVTCPNCRCMLQSDRPLRAGVSLRCPDCKTPFSAPRQADPSSSVFPAPAPSPSLIGAPLIIAATISLLLGGAIIAGAVIVAMPRTPAAKVDDRVDRGEEERRQLAEDRKKLAEERQRLTTESRKEKYNWVMKRADEALGKRLYADAKRGFKEALELMPSDAKALEGLETAAAGLATAEKSAEMEGKNKAEVDRLLAESKTAMTDKQYALAVRLLTAAQQIAPANRGVVDALLEAQKAVDADDTQKKKLAEYKKQLELGKTAMQAERYADAVKAYIAALQLMPDDLEAQNGQKQAEAKLLALGDKEKRQKAFNELLDRARVAQQGKRFKDAIAALNAALRINAGDPEAARLLRQAEKSQKETKAENAKLLAQANLALAAGRVAEAKQLLEDAVKNAPEDEEADKALKNLTRTMAAAQTAQVTWQQAVQAGVLAMAAGRYADAVTAYTQAVALNPNDLDSALALKKAQAALAQQLKATVRYNQLIKIGNNALATGASTQAIQAFSDALVLIPGDPVASAGLAQAQSLDRYNRAMSAGNRALSMKQKTSAIRSFNAALNEKPSDTQASIGLRKANMLR